MYSNDIPPMKTSYAGINTKGIISAMSKKRKTRFKNMAIVIQMKILFSYLEIPLLLVDHYYKPFDH